MDQVDVLHGVLFSRSIRAFYSVLHLAVEPSADHVVVIVQVENDDQATNLRSWVRRYGKLGSLLQVKGTWKDAPKNQTEWKGRRFLVHVASEQEAGERIIIKETHWYDVSKIQTLQQKYCPKELDTITRQQMIKRRRDEQGESEKVRAYRHGGGIGKRKQGELLSRFLVNMMAYKLLQADRKGHVADPAEWTTSKPSKQLELEAIKLLNSGTGVLDAAGGSGHLSMALGLAGIKSTIIDPRVGVGKLSKRDRKVWHRAIRVSASSGKDGAPLCQPYNAMRAWFAKRPDGVDSSFRNPDEADIPVCTSDDDLLAHCSAIVALHPDEATDSVVETAIQQQKPFVVVPCCVFARLFPDRRKPKTQFPVSTYDDLVEYLAAKDDTIRITQLPFDGANTALWATFN